MQTKSTHTKKTENAIIAEENDLAFAPIRFFRFDLIFAFPMRDAIKVFIVCGELFELRNH